DIAEEYGYQEALHTGLRAKGAIASSKGHVEEARAYNSRALELALEHDFPSAASSAYFILSDAEFRRDRYEAALAYLQDSLALARKFGSRPSEWAALAEMTYPLYMLGRWDEALGMIEDPSEEQTRSGGVLLALLNSVLEIYVERGQIDDARRIFSLFAHLADSTDRQDRSSYIAAGASLNRAEGRFQEALADADSAIEAASTLGDAQQGAKQAVVAALEAALAHGGSVKVGELIAFLEQAPPGRRGPFYDGQAHRFRARITGDEHAYERAKRIFLESGLPFWLAVVQLEHAELLLAKGRPDEAAALLEEARETFERLDARPWLERLAKSAPKHEAVAG